MWRGLRFPRRSGVGCGLPVLDPQPVDAGELADVVGDQDQVARPSLAGNQEVVGADGYPCRSQSRADVTSLPRAVCVERQDFEPHCLQGSKGIALLRTVEHAEELLCKTMVERHSSAGLCRCIAASFVMSR